MTVLYVLNRLNRLEKGELIGSGNGFYKIQTKHGQFNYRAVKLFYENGKSISKYPRVFGAVKIKTPIGSIPIFYHRSDVKVDIKKNNMAKRVYDYTYIIPDEYTRYIIPILEEKEINIAAKWLINL